MATEKDESTDTRKENQQPRNRGGYAEKDVSKGLETEQSDGPFTAPEKDTAKSKEKA